MSAQVKTVVLNGWAASPHAWDLCTFPRETVFSYTEQLDELPEQLMRSSPAETRFVLVGWSMGGSTALRLACRFPDRVAGMVLVAATARMMEDRQAGWRGLSPRRLEALHQSIRITHGTGFFGLPPDKPNPFMLDSEENLARGIDYLLKTDLRSDLQRFAAGGARFPVYIFHSERDGVVRPENAHFLKRIFSEAALAMVPGTEHALPVFIPELIDKAVLSIG